MAPEVTRRSFLQKLSLATLAAPLALAGKGVSKVWAAAKPLLKESDPLAMNFKYHKDASTVDGKALPMFKPGSDCSNCQQYTAVDDKTGTCTMFPNNTVVKGGWCMVYTAKPKK